MNGISVSVNISAPSLHSLTCTGLFPRDYSLTHDLSSDLLGAYLNLSPYPREVIHDDYVHRASNFFNIVTRNTKELELSESAMQLLWPQYLLDSLPTLSHLKHSTLDAYGSRGTIGIILRLLCRSPILEYLSIHFCGVGPAPSLLLQSYYNGESCSGLEEYSAALNCGAFTGLKVAFLSSMVADETQIHLLKIILEKARALERMTIKVNAEDNAEMVLNELTRSPRVSKSCLRKFNCRDLFILQDGVNAQAQGLQADGGYSQQLIRAKDVSDTRLYEFVPTVHGFATGKCNRS